MKLKCLLICCLILAGCSKNLEKSQEIRIDEKINKLDTEKKSNQFEISLLELHNKERTSRKIEELRLDKDLCKYAQEHAELMANKNSLYHSDMKDLLKFSNSSLVGENIAFGQKTEKEVVNSWMNSFFHKLNILKKSYKSVGFGMAKDKNGRIYWCTVFSNKEV